MTNPGPAPVTSDPGEWVISEARCMAILVRQYGWMVMTPDVMQRVRYVTRSGSIPRLKDNLPLEEHALLESDRSIADLAAAAAAEVA
jgi:hypothetical protein